MAYWLNDFAKVRITGWPGGWLGAWMGEYVGDDDWRGCQTGGVFRELGAPAGQCVSGRRNLIRPRPYSTCSTYLPLRPRPPYISPFFYRGRGDVGGRVGKGEVALVVNLFILPYRHLDGGESYGLGNRDAAKELRPNPTADSDL